jgi:putative two-component system response regulator
MHIRLQEWTEFIAIDCTMRTTLRANVDIIAPHMDAILDALYNRIASNPAAAAMFKSRIAMSHAREMQKRHWLGHVFVGNFDEAYLKAAVAIGQTHYNCDIDLKLYLGAYSVVMGKLIDIVTQEEAGQPERMSAHLSALQRAIFLDMGLATSVYYDSMVGALEDMANELNFALARAGEFRDNETGKHLSRMSKMCQALALELGQDPKWAQMLQVASPLHDVGKIGIPDQVLLKPGRLSEQELEVMRKHPTIGGSIIPEHASDVIRMARRISLTHHERWDGEGYPAGLQGEEIPLEGRIAAICDVYDALLSERPYKPAWSRDKAIGYLRDNSGKHFDPRLVEAFLAILPEIDDIQQRYAEDGEQDSLTAFS